MTSELKPWGLATPRGRMVATRFFGSEHHPIRTPGFPFGHEGTRRVILGRNYLPGQSEPLPGGTNHCSVKGNKLSAGDQFKGMRVELLNGKKCRRFPTVPHPHSKLYQFHFCEAFGETKHRENKSQTIPKRDTGETRNHWLSE